LTQRKTSGKVSCVSRSVATCGSWRSRPVFHLALVNHRGRVYTEEGIQKNRLGSLAGRRSTLKYRLRWCLHISQILTLRRRCALLCGMSKGLFRLFRTVYLTSASNEPSAVCSPVPLSGFRASLQGADDLPPREWSDCKSWPCPPLGATAH